MNFHRRIPSLGNILLVALFSVSVGVRAETVWNVVDDLGVVPSAAKPGVDAAIGTATSWLAANPSETLVLYFPPGVYEFSHPDGRGIDLNGATNLVFRGAGTEQTELIFGDFTNICIFVGSSRNVVFEQMHVTRTGLYTTQGEVVSAENGHIQFQVHEGFPDPVWLFNAGSAADYERTLLEFRGSDLSPEYAPEADKIKLADLTALGGGLFDAEMESASQAHNLLPGDRVALKSKCGHQTFRILGSDDCVLQDLKITRASGNPIRMPYGGNNLTVRRVVIDRAPPINGRTPFFSGPGGGIQLYAGEGGSLVEECVIIGTADDGIGIFSDDIENLSTNTVIRRNVVMDNQARGILITQTDGGICENNTLIRNHDTSFRIKVENSGGITNAGSAAVKNWVFRNNTLIDPWTAATFKFDTELPGGLHDNVSISSNLILRASKNNNVVQIDNAEDVVIEGNEIVSFSAEQDIQKWGASDALIRVEMASTVSGSNNTYFGTLLGRSVLDNQDPGAVVSVDWSKNTHRIFSATADTYVDESSPSANFGSSPVLSTSLTAGSNRMALVKFTVSGIAADRPVLSAKLRFMGADIYRPVEQPQLFACEDTSWSETGVRWGNRPAVGALLGSDPRKCAAGNRIEFNVSAVVTNNGVYAFYLHHGTGGESGYASRENELFLPPQLWVEIEPLPPVDPILAVQYTGVENSAAINPVRPFDVNVATNKTYFFDDQTPLFAADPAEGQRFYGGMISRVTSGVGTSPGVLINTGGRLVCLEDSTDGQAECFVDAFYLWDKADFQNGAENERLMFGDTAASSLAVDLFRNDGDARFVIRDGKTYYVSSIEMNEGEDQILTGETGALWAPWNPAGTGFATLPTGGFSPMIFSNVTAVGIVSVNVYRSSSRSARLILYNNEATGPGFTANLIPVEQAGFPKWEYEYGLEEGDFGDDDGDGVLNVHEYALGGDPTNAADTGFVPVFEIAEETADIMEYIYLRRRDYLEIGLIYELRHAPELLSADWVDDGFIPAGTGIVDAEFEAVTNRISTEAQGRFIRLRIGTGP